MTSELWQFVVLIGGIFVAAVLWLFIIYLPARTMEYSEARRAEEPAGERDASGRPG